MSLRTTLFLYCLQLLVICILFFFNDTATTEIYTLSLHDALPISNMEGNRIGDSARENGWAIRYRKQDGFIAICQTACRSEEHTSELQSPDHLVCRLLLEKKKKTLHADPDTTPVPSLYNPPCSLPP